jgi:hypothetical protein
MANNIGFDTEQELQDFTGEIGQQMWENYYEIMLDANSSRINE